MAEQKRVFKSKGILSGVRSEYHAWDAWDEGDTIICKLSGTEPNRLNKTKVNWKVEPLEVHMKNKKEQKRLASAKLVTLNCAGQLDKGLQQVAVGDIVQITYNGKKEMEGGDFSGKMAHLHEVILMTEDTGEEEESYDDEDSEDI